MSEKTIFPEWIKKLDRLPGILDYNEEKNIFAYAGEQAWLSKLNIADIEQCYIPYWAKASDGSDKIFSKIATPEECEARKFAKEVVAQREKEASGDGGILIPKELSGISMGTVMHIDDPTDMILNNGWIPGDKPEKEGWYEIIVGSIPTNPIEIDYYSFVLKKWRECNDWKINAYKPITLSPPYVPPEPERELLCPFCNAKFQSIELACDDYYFQCCVCRGSLPPKETKQEARQFLFEIYDKLNPLP